MGINKVMLCGNLTREPELRETASGLAVLGFSIAVNERRKNQQTGEWKEFANYVDCTMFGTRAASVAKHLSKGDKVALDGKLQYTSWETKDGQRRSKLEVIIDNIEFMVQARKATEETPVVPSAEPELQGELYAEEVPF